MGDHNPYHYTGGGHRAADDWGSYQQPQQHSRSAQGQGHHAASDWGRDWGTSVQSARQVGQVQGRYHDTSDWERQGQSYYGHGGQGHHGHGGQGHYGHGGQGHYAASDWGTYRQDVGQGYHHDSYDDDDWGSNFESKKSNAGHIGQGRHAAPDWRSSKQYGREQYQDDEYDPVYPPPAKQQRLEKPKQRRLEKPQRPAAQSGNSYASAKVKPTPSTSPSVSRPSAPGDPQKSVYCPSEWRQIHPPASVPKPFSHLPYYEQPLDIGNDQFKCQVCNTGMTLKNVQRYMSHLTGPAHVMRAANQFFIAKYDEPVSSDNGLDCWMCLENFSDKESYVSHLLGVRHKGMKKRLLEGASGLDDDKYDEPIITVDERYICKLCHCVTGNKRNSFLIHVDCWKHEVSKKVIKIRDALRNSKSYIPECDEPHHPAPDEYTCKACGITNATPGGFYTTHVEQHVHKTAKDKFRQTGELAVADAVPLNHHMLQVEGRGLGVRESKLKDLLGDALGIVMDPSLRTNECSNEHCVAFALFSTEAEAAVAYKFIKGGPRLGFKDLEICYAMQDDPEYLRLESMPQNLSDPKKLCVQGHNVQKKKNEVRALFPNARSVEFPSSKQKNILNVAFVHFHTAEEGLAAVEATNGVLVDGHPIEVKVSIIKPAKKLGKPTKFNKQKWAAKKRRLGNKRR